MGRARRGGPCQPTADFSIVFFVKGAQAFTLVENQILNFDKRFYSGAIIFAALVATEIGLRQ